VADQHKTPSAQGCRPAGAAFCRRTGRASRASA